MLPLLAAAALLSADLVADAPAPGGVAIERQVDAVAIGRDQVVRAGQRVDGIVVVGGDLRIEGEVEGDAVAIGGDVSLAPGGAVRGDAISVGGHVFRDSNAILQGDAVDLSGDLGTLSDRTIGRVVVLPAIPRSLLGVLFTELQLLGSFLVAFLVGALAPARVRRAASFLDRRPLVSGLCGLLLALLTVPATVILAVSVIGIPLIPALAVLLLVLLGAGMATLAVWLGDALPFLRGGSTLATLLLGYLTLALLALIPFLGPLLLPLANLVAAGAVVASGLGRGPAD